MSTVNPPVFRLLVVIAIAAALVGLGGVNLSRIIGSSGAQPSLLEATEPPVRIPLFVPPGTVDHQTRFRFTYDPAPVLDDLRQGEGLDGVVAGAPTEAEAWRRLARWTARQWEKGIPNPYPPPDARIILGDIRAGFTGGFCAQYCVVLIQAIQSFGAPARQVTIEGHEVVEAWVADELRWIMLDPTYDLVVLDGDGRILDALEIRRALDDGEADALRFSEGHRAAESIDEYVARFGSLAVWIRNDHISRPMNFTDFDRYRVWFDPRDPSMLPDVALWTREVTDLWPALPGDEY